MSPEEFKAWRLQEIKAAHKRFLEKKELEIETDPPDLLDDIETLFIGDKHNDER